METSAKIFRTYLPVLLLVIFCIVFAWNIPQNDLSEYFLPAGELMLQGDNPYLLNEAGPFIYWPLSLWIFPLFALIPYIQQVFLIINIVLLISICRKLNVSLWWCLYPPALYAVLAGQLDILVLWLAITALLLRRHQMATILIVLALCLKPQVALFWILPWFWRIPTWRKKAQATLLGMAIILVPVFIALLINSEVFISQWTQWQAGIQQHAGVYTGDSPSFWAIPWPLGALMMLCLWIIFSRDAQLSRPMLALGLPALRYYSTVALIGSVPVIVGLLAGIISILLTVIAGRPMFFIEPLLMLGYFALVRVRSMVWTPNGSLDSAS